LLHCLTVWIVVCIGKCTQHLLHGGSRCRVESPVGARLTISQWLPGGVVSLVACSMSLRCTTIG
jgi:hypothetical protein